MRTNSPALSGSDSGFSVTAAIICVSAAIFLFSVYNALGKWLAATYSPWQIMFFRGLFGLLPFVAYGLLMEGSDSFRSRRPMLQVLRAALGFSSNLLFIFAYREMPFADAVAIGYAAPIFIVALSVPLLSERVGVQRTLAALVGFAGVLMILQPGGGIFSPGALYALAGTLSYALLIICTRRLGAFDSAFCTVVYSSAVYTLASAMAMPQVWIAPAAGDFSLLAATGLLGGTGMLLFAKAYRHAQAAVLAPFDYVAMLWATLFGFVIWSEVPSTWAVAGMMVIAGSGLYLMRHARLQRFRPDKP